ncbi:MAG: DUF4197 domain-containing protein [Rubrivivax sp.]|nr:MAG: DUF4197 domain-containing protein [Rubrivivax sp.]
MTISRRILVGSLLSLAPLPAAAQFNLPGGASGVLNQVQGMRRSPAAGGLGTGLGAGLGQNEIGLGLKDAIKVASRRVVGQVGKPDGYFGDPSIRIPLPGPLERVREPLRMAGASGMLDDLVLRMNRGAEQAAPKALNIFVDAASNMSFDDARGILTGPQDSLTQYFRRTTSGTLTGEFQPIVRTALNGAGAMRVMQSVEKRASGIPFLGQSLGGFDLVTFTVGRALDGLFHYLGSEEASIRANPAARSTDLLRKVFG